MLANPDIFGQQRRNQRTTWLILIAVVVFFGFLGLGLDLFYLGIDPIGLTEDGDTGFPVATIAALLAGSVSAVWGYQSGAAAVIRSTRAYPVPENDPRFQTIRNVIDEMTIASGLPKPNLYIIPDSDPNAFATGKDPSNASIAVTEGLISTLSREELQGVIAHEMSHIRNYDIRLLTVVAAIVGAIFLLSDWAVRLMRFGGGGSGKKRKSSGGVGGPLGLILLAIWILAIVLAPVIGRLLAMAVSRQREYLADASSAELTRNPLALAKALEKLDAATDPTSSIKKGSAHLCIVDPLGKQVNLKEGGLAELFGTHPPISKRITLLKAMGYQITNLRNV